MEAMTETTTTTDTTTTAPESMAAPVDTAPTPEVQASGDIGGTDLGVPAADQWKPNFEFTVKDAKHQFDDWAKELVKNKEIEEKFRDLYSKSYGIDEIKADRQAAREQFEEVQEKYTRVEQSLKTLGEYVKQGDFRTFFEVLQIPRDKIIRYAIEELKYAELPPEERQAIEQQREMQQRLAQIENENRSLYDHQARLVMQQTESALNSELSKPEIAQIAQAYDARVGQPGAFRQEVIKRGAYYEATLKTTVPVGQAVQEVLTLVGGTGAPQATNPQVAGPGEVATQKKPVIPTFGGNSGASPTKKVYTSVDDLKKARQSLAETRG